MGNKSKQGRVTKPKMLPSEPLPTEQGQGQRIVANPDKLIALLRQKLEASEHRGMVLEVALDDVREELAGVRAQFDEIVQALPKEEEKAPKKKSKEK